MEFSADPYEYKLYQMFQSCDASQCGYLDENSLRRLCAQLELRDKGAVLIENLAREERTSHVTFDNFKEALLNFLGTEIDGANINDVAAEQRKDQIGKRISDVDKVCGGKCINIVIYLLLLCVGLRFIDFFEIYMEFLINYLMSPLANYYYRKSFDLLHHF